MPYTLNNPPTIPVQPGETQVTLDIGQAVAVAAKITRLGNGSIAFEADARQLTPTGTTETDANGHAITSACRFTLDASIVATNSAKACAKDAVLCALGEPPLTLTSLDAGARASWSIRNAIAAAAHAGPVTNLGSIL